MKDLQQATDRFAHCRGITPFDMRTQAKPLVECIIPVLLTQCPECFREVIGDKSVARAQEGLGGLWNLPAGQVKMKTVHDRQIEFLRERLEEIRGSILDERFHTLVQISHKYQRGISEHLRDAAAEPAVRHVILHDLDGIGVLNLHSPNFIESNDIPVTNQPDLTARIIVEEVSTTGFSAGDQDAIR